MVHVRSEGKALPSSLAHAIFGDLQMVRIAKVQVTCELSLDISVGEGPVFFVQE